MENYYKKILPNMSTALAPHHLLLQKQRPWSWGTNKDKVFVPSKAEFTSSCVLLYSDKHELMPACDALPYGVGAVLLHVMDDGSNPPVP